MDHESPSSEPDPARPENPAADPQPAADGLAADAHHTPLDGEEPVPEAEGPAAEESEPEPDAVAEGAEAEEKAAEPEPVVNNKSWYVVKVQSGREESIKEAIERRVKIEGLEEYFGQIIIPIERSVEMKNGKRVVRERKLYPGYLMVEVEYNDRMLYLFRETSGVGDFVGGGPNHAPQPMPEHEVERMLHSQKPGQEKPGRAIPSKPKFDRGDRVQVKDGVFAGMEGEVKDLIETKGMVRVELTVLGRPVAVELEYWQVESA
jgi:transcription termination/antitermination protein NusG